MLSVHKKILLLDIEKTRYRYLAVLYLFSFFGDIFLRLHLRDLCYTGHNERLKNRRMIYTIKCLVKTMYRHFYSTNLVPYFALISKYLDAYH